MLYRLSVLLILFQSLSAFAWGLKDLGEEAASPFSTDAKYVLIGGTAITAILAIFEDQIGDPFDAKQVRNRTLGDSSRFGNWLGQNIPNILYAGGMGIASRYDNPEAGRRAMGMLKATLYSSAVTTALKYTVREPRPNDISIKNSFPSGHTTTAFAFAGYVAAEHGWVWGGAAMAMGTFVAYSRINDDAHHLQDVTAGATIGWVYGWGMSEWQKKKQSENQVAILPIVDTRTAGMTLFKEF
jgi:hypothetical protein